MKTAMQELIEIMMDEWGEGRGLPNWAEEAIKKEKEQIIKAYEEGFDELTPFIKAEDYYNKTFNQNKIT